jgi:PadR family transcriptional regulator, regulatory protein PadR
MTGRQKNWRGTLYPALVRAWQTTKNKREAKYYTMTRSGVRAPTEQAAWRQRSVGLVNRLLASEE